VRIGGEAEGLHIVQGLEDGILESFGRRSRARDLRLDAEFEHIRSGEVIDAVAVFVRGPEPGSLE